MHVSKLTLSHFRNYLHAGLEVDHRPVVLLGDNGAGKTNILEAISLLTAGRGLRRAALSEIDLQGRAQPWAIAAEIEGLKGFAAIGTGREPAKESRIVKIDGKIARSQTDLGKIFSVIWLTPQMDNLFIEGGSERRKFIDRLVFSFDADHAARVNVYEKVMRERNRLLQEPGADDQWLTALEHKMAESGIAIATARAAAITRLNHTMLQGNEAFPKADIRMRGRVEENPVKDDFLQLLRSNRAIDRNAGRALIGIHRAAIEVMHVDTGMPAEFCSTGQQKALLISIIVAQARAGAQFHNAVPVMLLDEVTTHLDRTRRKALYEELAQLGTQAWLTGTDRELFEGCEAQFIIAENGALLR